METDDLKPSVSSVTQALLAPLTTLEPVSMASRSASQSSQGSPVSSPATCLTMLHNILSDVDNVFPPELRVNACVLLGSAGRKGTDNGAHADILRNISSSVLASLAQAPADELDERVRIGAQNALEAWN